MRFAVRYDGKIDKFSVIDAFIGLSVGIHATQMSARRQAACEETIWRKWGRYAVN